MEHIQHPVPSDFVVNPPSGNAKSDITTAAIKHLEPAVRAKGQAIDWDKFNLSLNSGAFNDMTGSDTDMIAAAVTAFLS